MPLYDYRCRTCSKVTEVRHGSREAHAQTCPDCGGELARVFHPAGIVFKGSGFYLTDSRKAAESGKTAAAGKTADAAASPDGAKTSDAAASAAAPAATPSPAAAGSTAPTAPAPASGGGSTPKKSESSAA